MTEWNKPRNFVLQKFKDGPGIYLDLPVKKDQVYIKLDHRHNQEFEKIPGIARCVKVQINDDEYIDVQVLINAEQGFIKQGKFYYLPLYSVKISSFVTYDDTPFALDTVQRNAPLTIDLFCDNVTDLLRHVEELGINFHYIKVCLDKLFSDRTLYTKVYHKLFSIAIFSPEVIAGSPCICDPVSFGNMRGDTFTTEKFEISQNSDPYEIAMDAASKAMDTPKEDFYFVNPEDPIVLYNNSGSDNED